MVGEKTCVKPTAAPQVFEFDVPCSVVAAVCEPGKGRLQEAVSLRQRQAQEDPIIGGEVVVEPEVALVDGVRRLGVHQIVVLEPILVRIGVELDEVFGERIETVCRDHVALKRLAGQRIVDGAVPLAGEVAVALCGGRHRVDPRVCAPTAGALVVHEEECLVLADRTAHRATELLEMERRLRGVGSSK
jgi:hypothetical protein